MARGRGGGEEAEEEEEGGGSLSAAKLSQAEARQVGGGSQGDRSRKGGWYLQEAPGRNCCVRSVGQLAGTLAAVPTPANQGELFVPQGCEESGRAIWSQAVRQVKFTEAKRRTSWRRLLLLEVFLLLVCLETNSKRISNNSKRFLKFLFASCHGSFSESVSASCCASFVHPSVIHYLLLCQPVRESF